MAATLRAELGGLSPRCSASRTADDRASAALHGRASRGAPAARSPAAHTKNLFLKDKKGAVFLVVARRGECRNRPEAAPRAGSAPPGRASSFGAADLLLEALGVTPGLGDCRSALVNDREGAVASPRWSSAGLRRRAGLLIVPPARQYRDDTASRPPGSIWLSSGRTRHPTRVVDLAKRRSRGWICKSG